MSNSSKVHPTAADQATAGREVAGRRQRQPGALAHAIDRLHQRLAESRLTDDVGTIVILQRTGHDFEALALLRLTSTTIGQVQMVAVVHRPVVLIGVVHAAARVDDHRALWHEPVGDANRLIELPAGIAAQIEDEALHPLRRHLVERLAEILVGVSAKSSTFT